INECEGASGACRALRQPAPLWAEVLACPVGLAALRWCWCRRHAAQLLEIGLKIGPE
ncbi:unnamed protein product, partial [Prorocentrum cordatum]